MAAKVVVSITVVTDDALMVARAAEVMARAAAGLALEGTMVSVTIGMVDDDDDPPGS